MANLEPKTGIEPGKTTGAGKTNSPASATRNSASTTYADFLDSEQGREACDPELRARLAGPAADSITTLSSLIRWVKERYPDHYGADPRRPSGKPFGREAMARLWAKYLTWAEQR